MSNEPALHRPGIVEGLDLAPPSTDAVAPTLAHHLTVATCTALGISAGAAGVLMLTVTVPSAPVLWAFHNLPMGALVIGGVAATRAHGWRLPRRLFGLTAVATLASVILQSVGVGGVAFRLAYGGILLGGTVLWLVQVRRWKAHHRSEVIAEPVAQPSLPGSAV